MLTHVLDMIGAGWQEVLCRHISVWKLGKYCCLCGGLLWQERPSAITQANAVHAMPRQQ